MRLRSPRIAPVPQEDWTAEQTALATPLMTRGPILNIFRTLLGHPDALRAFLGWASYVLSKRSTLPAREREIVVLRIGFLCRSGYEWTQHCEIGERAGLTKAEITAIKQGAQAPNWRAPEIALIKACDELHGDQFIWVLQFSTSLYDHPREMGNIERASIIEISFQAIQL